MAVVTTRSSTETPLGAGLLYVAATGTAEPTTSADLAAASQISVADYLGGIDWTGHAHAKAWYAAFKSRRSFRPLLTERVSGIEPPSYYENPDF